MASRRTRIKGLTNIPQRKKTEPNGSRETKKEDPKVLVDSVQNNESTSPPADEITQQSCKTTLPNEPAENSSEQIIESSICDNHNLTKSDERKTDVTKTTNDLVGDELSATQSNNTRRKFLKPSINISSANKRRVQDNKNEDVVIINQVSDNDIVNTDENIANDDITNQTPSEMVLNETDLFSTDIPPSRPSVVTFSPHIKHVVPDIQSPPLDVDYSVSPSSPTKYNRRIKAVPRLNQRKTSFSASESEDESRRHGRIRNNSVCSVASTIGPDPPTPLSDNMNNREITAHVQKKMCRTDQSRKLAEARKEFHKRFGSANPDKQKLKMIDLIFYNPTTNPMSQQDNGETKPPATDNTDIQNENNIEVAEEEEAVDDPTKENNSENGMPTPQIKIGPSGDIILDEKSLLVENTELLKQKERLQNMQIIDGNYSIGYGIYTRAVRSKDWTPKETLRFYKALTLIGTDFTTMSKLFPKRSRRELKLKFNKEEKVNRQLIDKAIMQPCNYNFNELKREIEIEEEEEATVQKLKEKEIEQRKKNKQLKRGKKRKSRLEGESVQPVQSQMILDDVPLADTSMMGPNEKITSKSSSGPKKIKSLNITSVLQSDSDADVSDLEAQSDCDDQVNILPSLQQTRSGRMPKIIQRYSGEPLPPPSKKHRHSLSSFPELNSDKLVPGSVVILSDDNSEFKVCMVTPDKQLTDLPLSDDVVSNIIRDRQQNDEIVLQENYETNITIPATVSPTIMQNEAVITDTGTYMSL